MRRWTREHIEYLENLLGVDLRKGRANRRANVEKSKAEARRIMRVWQTNILTKAEIECYTGDDRKVGHNAETHCRPCSCWICKSQKPMGIKNRGIIDESSEEDRGFAEI
jgi:hypothetical protein